MQARGPSAPAVAVLFAIAACRAGSAPGKVSPQAAEAKAAATASASPERSPEGVARPAPWSARLDSGPSVPTTVLPPEPPPAEGVGGFAGSCPRPTNEADDVGLLVSPVIPRAHERLQVLAAGFDGDPMYAHISVRVRGPDGRVLPWPARSYYGEPDAVHVSAVAPRAGRYRVEVAKDGAVRACATLRVRPAGTDRRARDAADPWPVLRSWTAGEEALFSAWVRLLFWAPRDAPLAEDALHALTSDPSRNVLWNALGLSEDAPPREGGLFLQPDCADTPYLLRAYYAWKRGLPMGFRHCSRGAGKAPRCGPLQDLRAKIRAEEGEPVLAAISRLFRRTLPWGVHSGNTRTAHLDDRTDFYPVTLSPSGLRPGAIYADPYGHVFVVAGWFPPAGGRPGVLYAIDGQPDGSLTRKPFWEGNFLWNPDPTLGGSGFKQFRPVFLERDRLVAAANDRLAGNAAFPFHPGPYDLTADAFYDAIYAVVSPDGGDPEALLAEKVRYLAAAAKVRARSVENGWRYVQRTEHREIPMPDGAEIFETQGPWEDYATPARDLRFLVAIDAVMGFADKVLSRPKDYGVAAEDRTRVAEALARRLETWLSDPAHAVTYRRSDGSEVTLPLKVVVERARAFETAYHPNDCPEVRWGAPEGSAERRTCRHRAPPAARRKMEAYRPWFRKRTRPPRGDPGPKVPGR